MSAEVLAVDPADPAPQVLERALAVLAAAGLLIYPTDTLYALGGLGLSAQVAVRVRQAKGRPDQQALPLIAGSLEQARGLVLEWSDAAHRLALRFWPGPLSLVVPARAELPQALLGAGRSVALRVPACELARRLASAAGPLISTSANRSGAAAPLTCQQALAAVGETANLALDGGRGRDLPSTIVDLTGRQPQLLRAGQVPWDDVLEALG